MRYLSGLAIVLAVASSAMALNLLTNPSFDTPAGEGITADGWTVNNPANFPPAPATAEPVAMFQPWANHTGDRGLWFKSFLGNAQWISPVPPPANADVYQDVPGMAGDSYTLSGWFKFEKYYTGLNPLEPTQTLLAIDYLDAASGVLGSSILDVDTVYPTNPDGTSVGTWQQYSVSGIAPAGTAFVRARVSLVDGTFAFGTNPDGSWYGLNPQSPFADDLMLTPEPASLVALLALAMLRRR